VELFGSVGIDGADGVPVDVAAVEAGNVDPGDHIIAKNPAEGLLERDQLGAGSEMSTSISKGGVSDILVDDIEELPLRHPSPSSP
jgi:hypothetical protein